MKRSTGIKTKFFGRWKLIPMVYFKRACAVLETQNEAAFNTSQKSLQLAEVFHNCKPPLTLQIKSILKRMSHFTMLKTAPLTIPRSFAKACQHSIYAYIMIWEYGYHIALIFGTRPCSTHEKFVFQTLFR